ncbi:MAG: hypothetical protein PHC75_07770 [Burkholderiales bacterium]|nr:hypothetical protein [Burkholderiales bacterium]
MYIPPKLPKSKSCDTRANETSIKLSKPNDLIKFKLFSEQTQPDILHESSKQLLNKSYNVKNLIESKSLEDNNTMRLLENCINKTEIEYLSSNENNYRYAINAFGTSTSFKNCSFTALAPIIGVTYPQLVDIIPEILYELDINLHVLLKIQSKKISNEELLPIMLGAKPEEFLSLIAAIKLNKLNELTQIREEAQGNINKQNMLTIFKNHLTLDGIKLILSKTDPNLNIEVHNIQIKSDSFHNGTDKLMSQIDKMMMNNFSCICHLGPHLIYGQKNNNRLEFIDFQLDNPLFNNDNIKLPKVMSEPTMFNIEKKAYISFKDCLEYIYRMNNGKEFTINLLTVNKINEFTASRVELFRKVNLQYE